MVEEITLPLLIEQVFTRTQTSGMCWNLLILSLFMSGTYTYTNKVIQCQTEKKEPQCLITGKGRNNLNTRMQLHKGTYILTGQI